MKRIGLGAAGSKRLIFKSLIFSDIWFLIATLFPRCIPPLFPDIE